MSDRAGELLLTEPAALDALPAALQAAFAAVASEPDRSVRRVWFDTFDRRLSRGAIQLEHRTGAGPAGYRLRSDTGERLNAPGRASAGPRLVDALPTAEIRDRLRPVVEMRALLPIATSTGVRRVLRLCNPDGKTVATVEVEETATPPAVPPRVTVAALRGYADEAELAVRALLATPGATPAVGTALDAVLAAGGPQPAYSSKVDVAQEPAMPASAALARVLLRLLDTLEANVDGVLADVDTEFLHDLRVSVRRTRSALKLAGGVLSPGLADRFGAEFRWLGDVTTPTRDLDVYLLGYDDMVAGLTAPVAELEPFRAFLSRRRAAEQRRLVRRLRSERFATLTGRWRAALSAETEPGGGTAAELAATVTSKAFRRVIRDGSAIVAESPAEELHDLRKRCKELRYLLEFFAALHEPAAHRRLVGELKTLQDCLGDFQDGEVQRDAVRRFAAELLVEHAAPAVTLLGMGELAAGQHHRQQTARAEFVRRFARFARPTNHRLVAELVGAGG